MDHNDPSGIAAKLRALSDAVLEPDPAATQAFLQNALPEILASTDPVSSERVMDGEHLANDSYELAIAYLEKGDLIRAERWLKCAERYGLEAATRKLAEIAVLDEVAHEIDTMGSELTDIPNETIFVSIDKSEALEPSRTSEIESVKAIIADARREAEMLIESAKSEAARIIARHSDLISPDLRRGSNDVKSVSESILWASNGTGKTALLASLINKYKQLPVRILVTSSWNAGYDHARTHPVKRHSPPMAFARRDDLVDVILFDATTAFLKTVGQTRRNPTDRKRFRLDLPFVASDVAICRSHWGQSWVTRAHTDPGQAGLEWHRLEVLYWDSLFEEEWGTLRYSPHIIPAKASSSAASGLVILENSSETDCLTG